MRGDGTFRLDVVGESMYHHELESICGGKTEGGVDVTVPATLILEDSNPYDRNAVRVEIRYRTVGYLARGDAEAFNPGSTVGRVGDVTGQGLTSPTSDEFIPTVTLLSSPRSPRTLKVTIRLGAFCL